MVALTDLTGQIFGRLTVIKRTDNSRSGNPQWLCRCTCGNEAIVLGSCLRRHSTKSCGCLNSEASKARAIARNKLSALPNGDASFNRMYGQYKKHAKEANREFALTKEHFRDLTSQSCLYCGTKPKANADKSHHKFNGVYLCNGVDRLDNDLGYTIDNSAPCCSVCNRAKATMSKDEFIIWVERVYNYSYIRRHVMTQKILIIASVLVIAALLMWACSQCEPFVWSPMENFAYVS